MKCTNTSSVFDFFQKSFVQIQQLLMKTSMKHTIHQKRKILKKEVTVHVERCSIDILTIHLQLRNHYQKTKLDAGCYHGGKQQKWGNRPLQQRHRKWTPRVQTMLTRLSTWRVKNLTVFQRHEREEYLLETRNPSRWCNNFFNFDIFHEFAFWF